MRTLLKKFWHAVAISWLLCQPALDRWERLCNLNREFHRARNRWTHSKDGTPEQHANYRELTKLRDKLHLIGESLGMSESATELPLPIRYRFEGTPPMPKWLRDA